MSIQPDTKDWTWVLQRRCPECGFDAQQFPREDVGAMLREAAALWARLLVERTDGRVRPRPDMWSPLEYGCHVRDVFRLYDERLALMLTQDGPAYPNWDQDDTALEQRYADQDPGVVALELSAAAQPLADRFDALRGEQWERTGFRSDGAQFTVETFARYFIHDPVHHLHDVGVRYSRK